MLTKELAQSVRRFAAEVDILASPPIGEEATLVVFDKLPLVTN